MLNTVLDSHKFRISVKAGKFYYKTQHLKLYNLSPKLPNSCPPHFFLFIIHDLHFFTALVILSYFKGFRLLLLFFI
jgi:hypothetical protein